MDVLPARTRRIPVRPLTATALSLSAIALLGGCVDTDTATSTGAVRSADAGAGTGRRAPGREPAAATDLEGAYERVIKDVLPSVVQIQGRKGLGSGIVYDSAGHVVTNAHVVGDEKTFRVTSASSGGALTAKLVFSYPDQDLAVVKLNRVQGRLKAATFGNSSAVQVGQIVLAMGSPLGLSSSVTQGIVSATGRTVSEGESNSMEGGTGATIIDMVQTSAAINPGNSGGALVGLDGEVIGIPTLAATDPRLNGSAAPGIGFAIPSHTVTTVADQIIRTGKVTNSGRAALGVTVRTVLGSNFQPQGAALVKVKKGGPADRAGLKEGDVITRLGTKRITTISSLTAALAHYKPGNKVTVRYERDGARKSAQVTLGSM